MRYKQLDTKEATVKWWAAQDASMRNIANASLYTDKQKLRAERMKLVLGEVFSAQGIHINYRKTKIAVKVDKRSKKRERTGRNLQF